MLLQADERLGEFDILGIGYSTRLVPDLLGLWSADAPLARLAQLFYTAAAYSDLARYKSLAIIAHSMGGLLVQRALVDRIEFSARVSHICLFGTPSAGISLAGPFRFLKRQLRDMAESGEFILDLRERWNTQFRAPLPFRFWTIAGDRDEFVPCSSSLKLFNPSQQLVIPGDHTSIVKPKAASDLAVKIVADGICGEAAPSGPGNAARVAIESREFVRVIQLLEPSKDDLDARGRVDLALALEEVGRESDAIALLEQGGDDSTDAMGVLAGRLKRRWLVERRRDDAARALALYRRAYQSSTEKEDSEQAFYHGTNVSFMELAYRNDGQAAQAMARQVLDHCASARRDFWRLGAEADARLILDQDAEAFGLYEQAVALDPAPRWLKSMCQQAVRTADLLHKDDAVRRILLICRGTELDSA